MREHVVTPARPTFAYDGWVCGTGEHRFVDLVPTSRGRWRARASILGVVLVAGCLGELGDLSGAEPAGGEGGGRPTPVGPRDTLGPQVPDVNCAGDITLPPAPARVVPIQARQYRAEVEALLDTVGLDGSSLEGVQIPFRAGGGGGRFSTRADLRTIDDAGFADVVRAAEQIADRYLEGYASSPSACPGDRADSPCWAQWVGEVGRRVWRRPLEEAEREALRGLFDGAENAWEGARAAVEALLISPHFVFRGELPGRLDGHGIAAHLSHVILDGPAPDWLEELASEGGLEGVAGVRAAVDRMLAALDDQDALLRFLREFFGYGAAPRLAKSLDGAPLPAEELVRETDRWLQEQLRRAGNDDLIGAVLTSESSFVSEETEHVYGLGAAEGTGALVEAPGRAGLLAQPSWLVSFSLPEENDPVHRGKFIQLSLLCGTIPPAPIDDIPPIPEDPDQTLRERLSVHTSGSCASCHQLMDPLGLPFEAFDHYGRPRLLEAGRPVVTTGELRGSGDATDGEVSDARDLAGRLADSDVVRACFYEHALMFWGGRPRRAEDRCFAEHLVELDRERGFRAALVELLAQEALRARSE